MTSAKKLVKAQREVERLEMEAAGATPSQIDIWKARNVVRDVQTSQASGTVRGIRRAAWFMDLALAAVAVLTMAFSLGNIHRFALVHAVQNPIAWFLAPAVDIALVAAIVGDAFLSRHQLDAGTWATRLRWYAGVSTLVLNTWSSVTSINLASILLHTVPPVLLIVLAEAAPRYRRKFAETLDKVVRDVAPVSDLAQVRDVAHESTSENTLQSPPDLPKIPAPVEEESVYAEAPAEPTEAPAETPTETAAEEPTKAPTPVRAPRPRRSTGKVPAAAKSARPKRSMDELLDAARALTLDDDEVSAEKIRTELRIGPPKARELRDAIKTEREQVAALVAADEDKRRHGLHAVPTGADAANV